MAGDAGGGARGPAGPLPDRLTALDDTYKIKFCFGLAEARRRVVCLFESLTERLQGIFKSLRGQGVLKEAQVDAALREIRLALLEADVHFRVVKQLARARPRAGDRARTS